MTGPIDFRLYLITDRACCAPRPLDDVVREACAAGVRAVQLRDRDASAAEVSRLCTIAHEHGAKLFVNARTIAAMGAAVPAVDGLHFPDHPHVLNCGESPLMVGRSVHSLETATACSGVDFLLFGPVLTPISKTSVAPPRGLEALGAVARAVDVPVFALGGVTPDNARACLDAGAHGVAVVGSVMGAHDVAAAVRRFKDALGGAL